jgi:hypothetical protein
MAATQGNFPASLQTHSFEETMSKLLTGLLALAFAATAFAQGTAPAPQAAPAPAPAASAPAAKADAKSDAAKADSMKADTNKTDKTKSKKSAKKSSKAKKSGDAMKPTAHKYGHAGPWERRPQAAALFVPPPGPCVAAPRQIVYSRPVSPARPGAPPAWFAIIPTKRSERTQ